MNFPRSQRSELYKTKKHKDLSFLLQKKEEALSDFITKYQIKQGSGLAVQDIKVPLTIYYSYEQFDYTGKFVFRATNKSISHPFIPKQGEAQQKNISMCLTSMQLNQKSWFNIQKYEKENTSCSGYHGHHYQITLQNYNYKNDNTAESKKLVYEQNRQKGKVFFSKKNFKQAIKVYLNSINILSGLSKKYFNPDQLKVLNEYKDKSQANYLKCVAKLNGFGGRYISEIGKKAKQLSERIMKNQPTRPSSYYQKAAYLKYQSRFGDAEDAIKQGFKQQFDKNEQQAAKEKQGLKNMLQEIKKVKQRNIRHLKRQQIRKIKTQRRNKDVWDIQQETA